MYTPHLLDKNIKKLMSLYKTDMTLAQIAKQLHVSQTTLRSKIKELNLKRKPRLRTKVIKEKLFRELLAKGLSNVSIANRLHICVNTVVKRKKQWGIFVPDEQIKARAKKSAVYRAYYRKMGTHPESTLKTNILERHKDTIIPLLENGIQKTKIANRYGVCLSTVYNFINLYGLKAPVKKICDNKEKIVQTAFDDGDSLEDISKKIKCSRSTVYLKIKDMGLNRSVQDVRRKSLLNNQKDTIAEMYYQGVPCTRIADKLGVSSTSMYAFISRMRLGERKKQVKRYTSFSRHDTELWQMHQDGMSLRKIAKHFGVHVNTVLYRLKKLSNENMGCLN